MKNFFKVDPALLEAGSGVSSMRYVMIHTFRLVWVLVIASIVLLFVLAYKHDKIDWYGYAAFIGSITVLIGTVVTGKVIQNKQEQNYSDNGNGEQVHLDGGGHEEPGGS